MVESSSNAPYRSQKFKAKGQAVLRSHRDQPESDLSCSFTHLSYSFPLKLLSPRITSKDALNSARRQRLKSQLSSDDTSLPKKDSSSSKALNGSDAPYIFSLEEEAERVEREKQKERVSTSKISSDKVESKPHQDKAIAALFIVGYGGGLVSGDSISLEIDVGSDSTLLLLTQGSTKVFKSRRSFSSKQELTLERKQVTNNSRLEQTSNSSFIDPSSSTTTTTSSSHDSNSIPSKTSVESNPTTSQIFKCLIRKDSTLILLPDPVTCFTNSKYYQTQFFDLRDRKTSSLVLLDWITPGRMLSVGSELGHGRGNVGFETAGNQVFKEKGKVNRYGQHSGPELWQFESYRSRNEIRVQGEIVVRDLLFLDQEIINQTSNPFSNLSNSSPNSSRKSDSTSLATRLSPYTCYATLFLFGPDCKSTIDHLKQLYRRIQQRILIKPQDLIWSCSELGPGGGISQDVEGKEEVEGQGNMKEIPEALVIRIAGKETELVRNWLRENLWELKKVVGSDLYKTALG